MSIKDSKKELAFIKHLMNFNVNEGRQKMETSGIEHQNIGADGKTYGIVREGTKYYIMSTDKTKDVVKEDFEYIGGFRNRADNCYESYNKALKNFDLKMISLKEAFGNGRNVVVESWNPAKKEVIAEESTAKMRNEIMRAMQIMENSECAGCKVKTDSTMKQALDLKGSLAPFTQSVPTEDDGLDGVKENQKTNIKGGSKPVVGKEANKELKESTEVLGWNDDPDYLDMSHGTEVGDGEPFEIKAECDKKGCKDKPFCKKPETIEEDEEIGMEDTMDDDTETIGEPMPVEGGDAEAEEENLEPMPDNEIGDEDDDEEEFDDDMEARLDAIEDLLDKIADKVGADNFEDEKLYDDNEEPEFEVEMDEPVAESRKRSGRRVNEGARLDYFGKHPAYRKKPMDLPSASGEADGDLYDQPYGQKIGDGAPFEVDIDEIENAIAESINMMLKKK